MFKIKSALLASLLFLSTALPTATYANVQGTVEAENSSVQNSTTTTTETTDSGNNPVVQEETVKEEKDAESISADENAEQTPSTPAQPEEPQTETSPENEISEEQDSPANTEQPADDESSEQPVNQPLTGQKLTVKQKLADVPDSFWAKNEVMQLVEMGVIGGYPDAQFRPNLNINRGQAANLFK